MTYDDNTDTGLVIKDLVEENAMLCQQRDRLLETNDLISNNEVVLLKQELACSSC